MPFGPEAMSICSRGNLVSQRGYGTIKRLKGSPWTKCGYRAGTPGLWTISLAVRRPSWEGLDPNAAMSQPPQNAHIRGGEVSCWAAGRRDIQCRSTRADTVAVPDVHAGSNLNWIDKHQLDLFAETTGARLRLPRLVSELILATSEIPDVIRFLADESGQVRGFDGVLVSPGAPPFVPAGKSYWEFGCSKDVRKKAREDLEARTLAVDPLERAQATLVLVTPRHYDTPTQLLQEFVDEISASSGWASVQLLDGQGLKHWLDLAPGVAARWARRDFRSQPEGVWSVDEYWHQYA